MKKIILLVLILGISAYLVSVFINLHNQIRIGDWVEYSFAKDLVYPVEVMDIGQRFTIIRHEIQENEFYTEVIANKDAKIKLKKIETPLRYRS